tara:strand:- start:8136 stop:9011 length:876 start_codon:yes stop_codon:yes gene_type:complete
MQLILRISYLPAALFIFVTLFALSSPILESIKRPQKSFDHLYRAYGTLLNDYVSKTKVDYQNLKLHRVRLDTIVDTFGQVTEDQIRHWSREKQIAYWVNAYNIFTLQAIVNNYPFRRTWFSWLRLSPYNSIKQISGVWTRLKWQAAGRQMTLDEIEHQTLRLNYDEPRIHFVVNCAAVSCPPLRAEPITGTRLNEQLTIAARDFLKSEKGLMLKASEINISKIFDWYGDDFIENYANLSILERPIKEKAILGVVSSYGPPKAARIATSKQVELRFLRYDWTLNDVSNASSY